MRSDPHLRKHRSRQRGSILVICLVIAGVGTIGAAAFFSLIHAKSDEAQARETAILRRARVANSDAMARETMLQRCASTDAGTAIEAVTVLANSWGENQIADYSSIPLGFRGSVRLNKTGAAAHTAYSADIYGPLIENGVKIWRQFQAKSVNPALAGDLLVVESQSVAGAPAIEFTGDLSIQGRAVFWNSNYATSTASLKASRVIAANPTSPKLSLVNPLNQPILPDNLPLPAMTSGRVNGTPAFNGVSRLVGNPDNAANDYLDTITPITGAALPGNLAFVETSSAVTNPSTVNDSILLGLINSLLGLPSSLRTTLQANVPLSSAVLTAVIAQATSPTDAQVLIDILDDNRPLPRDVLTQVIDGSTALTSEQVWEVLAANPVSVALDGAGTAFIDLDDPSTDHVIINGDISTLTLRGQGNSAELAAAAAMPPLVIVLHHDSGTTLPLTTLTLEGANQRPLILAIRKHSDNTAVELIATGTSAFPVWRGILDLDNVELLVDTSSVSTLSLKGGIRTNRSLKITDGAMLMIPESDSLAIDALRPLASRNAWVEAYAINAPPTP